jgi:hypothetical protein
VADSTFPAVVVAGMHRSGTSFVASLLQAAGYGMGARQLAADRTNRKGYFEDVDFLDLNRRMLRAAVPGGDAGHHDWGWTESERLDAHALEAFRSEANVLVEARRAQHAPWGWKDPRTSRLLEFWHARLREARYVLVYRFPWEVADSMQRLGADVFLRHPGYAPRIWRAYNEDLLTFFRAHRDRSILVSANALMRDASRLAPLLASRLGLAVTDDADLRALADPEIFESAGGRDPLAALFLGTHPDCASMLRAIEHDADIPSGDADAMRPFAAPKPPAAPAVSVVIPCFNQGEWAIDAIASVERTVTTPYELTVVDDGSTEPETIEILRRLDGAGYAVARQENRGLAEARNRGARDARAPLYLPLDADNRVRAGFVDAAVDALARDPGADAVYGDRMDFGLRSMHVPVDEADLDRMLCGNFIDACAVVRVSAWQACGGYDASLPSQGLEDWDFWLSLLERGRRLIKLDLVAFDYRVRPGSMLSTFDVEAVRAETERYIVAKHAATYLTALRVHVLTPVDGELPAAARRAVASRVELERDLARARADAGAARAERDRLGQLNLEAQLEAHRALVREAEARQELSEASAERDGLRTLLDRVQATKTWKLHQRLTRWAANAKKTSP